MTKKHEGTELIQQGLLKLGYDLGRWGADGIYGPTTENALRSYMNRSGNPVPKPVKLPRLAWIDEAKKMFGKHETRDNAELRAYLRSDGKTLGDPDALPWCGDYVETVIKNSMPSENFTGPLAENPYWARNWLFFGRRVNPCYGCILVFERNSGGHVGFGVGEDDNDYYVLGGNQSDSVNIVRINKRRLLQNGARWPISNEEYGTSLPAMTPMGIPLSTNEF